MKKIIPLLLLLTASSITSADNTHFSVQVAAIKNPDLAHFREVAEFGSLYTEETRKGLTRVKVGSYTCRADAKRALKAIRGAGLTDAFITDSTKQFVTLPDETPVSFAAIVVSNETQFQPEGSSVISQQLTPWARLNEEQRRDVIYQDGCLRLPQNGEFIPLSSY